MSLWIDNFFGRRSRQLKGGEPSRSAFVISTVMCKGGVGKTTITRLLSEAMANRNKKILLIDADPQGNLSTSLHLSKAGFDLTESTPVFADVLSGMVEPHEAVLKVSENLHLIPSTAINSLADKYIERSKRSVNQFREILKPLLNSYEYVFFDTAPALNLLNAGVILTSDLVLLPTNLDEFSRIGLGQTIGEIDELKSHFRSRVGYKILVNRFEEEKNSLLFLGLLSGKYKGHMLSTVIRNSQNIKDRVSLLTESVDFTDSNDFSKLAEELENQLIELKRVYA